MEIYKCIKEIKPFIVGETYIIEGNTIFDNGTPVMDITDDEIFTHFELMMVVPLIQQLTLTEKQVWLIVKEWYTNGMYADILQDEDGNDLEEICGRHISSLLNTGK